MLPRPARVGILETNTLSELFDKGMANDLTREAAGRCRSRMRAFVVRIYRSALIGADLGIEPPPYPATGRQCRFDGEALINSVEFFPPERPTAHCHDKRVSSPEK